MNSERKNTNRHAPALLFIATFIVMLGFGVILPILPFYAETLGATATLLGILFSIYSVVQFLFSPIWGQLSDRVGRKGPILLGQLGLSVSFLMFGFATELWMLFAARILGGVLSAAILPAVMAYVADTTDEAHRGASIGYLGAAAGIGIAFGPVVGGVLAEISIQMPFFFSAGIGVVVVLAMFILLPESLPPEKRKKVTEQVNFATSMQNLVLSIRSSVGFIMLLAFLVSFVGANLSSLFALFAQAGLGFGESEIGIIFGVIGFTMMVTQGVLVGPLLRHWGEQRMIQFGLLFSAIGYACLLFAVDIITMSLAMVVMGLGNGTMRPSLTSLISIQTSADEQGNVMGVVHSYNSLGRIFGPIAGGILFDKLGYQSPFIVGTLIFFLSFLFSIPRLSQMQKKSLANAGTASSVD